MVDATVIELKRRRCYPRDYVGPFETLCLSVIAKLEAAPSEECRRLTEPTFDALRVIYTLMAYVELLVDKGNMEEKRVVMASGSLSPDLFLFYLNAGNAERC